MHNVPKWSDTRVSIFLYSVRICTLFTQSIEWAPFRRFPAKIRLSLEFLYQTPSLYKKRFPLMISLVNVTKSAVSCEFGLIY